MCLKKLNIFSLVNFILNDKKPLFFFANLSEYSACFSSSFKISRICLYAEGLCSLR